MRRSICLMTALGWTSLVSAQAQAPRSVSEVDFLSEMPIVLSVSRLPQRLDETPGAVTLIDREWIRLSGARDLADLLRLVPGFQSSLAFETGAPQASYHGAFGGFSSRIQVLVDGRSVYSPFFMGSIALGLQSVVLGDIERIEVLRGTNSATYGARAMLGVVNIITRHTEDTPGLQVTLGGGQNGVRDAQARLGGATDNASYRLTVDHRADAGLIGSNGHSEVGRVNFRADLRINAQNEVQLRAGATGINSGQGFVSSPGDPLRDRHFDASHVQLDWNRSLDADSDLAVSYSHMQETSRDTFPYSLRPLGLDGSIDIDFSGRASNDNLALQHTFRRGADLRVVWGGELRRERVQSPPLYNTDATFVTDFTRLFGSAEWHMAPSLVLNAGAMAEHSSLNGSMLSPRLTLNWQAAEGHTLRAGVSTGGRPPSTFEKYADVRYFWRGQLLKITTLSDGTTLPERVSSRELGYLVNLPQWGLQADVRAFHERIDGFIWRIDVNGPPLRYAYVNYDDIAIKGLEYQLKWRPWRDAQLTFNQARINITSANLGLTASAPRLATILALHQKLAGGLDLSLSHQNSGLMTLQGYGDRSAIQRTDVRLGAPLRFGRYRGELALVVQNLGQPNPDFRPDFQFQRRAFVTLRLEN